MERAARRRRYCAVVAAADASDCARGEARGQRRVRAVVWEGPRAHQRRPRDLVRRIDLAVRALADPGDLPLGRPGGVDDPGRAVVGDLAEVRDVAHLDGDVLHQHRRRAHCWPQCGNDAAVPHVDHVAALHRERPARRADPPPAVGADQLRDGRRARSGRHTLSRRAETAKSRAKPGDGDVARSSGEVRDARETHSLPAAAGSVAATAEGGGGLGAAKCT